jgi:hypothetical protein
MEKTILGESLSGDRIVEVEFLGKPHFVIIRENFPEEKIKNEIRLDFDEIDELCRLKKLKQVV